MDVGIVAALWRYPVKSMLGEDLTAAPVTDRGLAGDRASALRDRATGKIASAKLPRLWGRLLACRAAFAVPPLPGSPLPPVRIRLPDGRPIASDHAAAAAALFDRDIELVSDAPAGAEIDRYWPDIDGLAARDAVTAGPLARAAPPGTFFDHAPLHLPTTATLRRLRELAPEGDFDPSRFRPNLLVELPADATGFVERDWVGRRRLVGDAVRLRVTDPSPRCVVTTLPQAGLPRDLGILRTVVAHGRAPIPALGGHALPSAGVYAVVERGGTVRRGDPIRLAADDPSAAPLAPPPDSGVP